MHLSAYIVWPSNRNLGKACKKWLSPLDLSMPRACLQRKRVENERGTRKALQSLQSVTEKPPINFSSCKDNSIFGPWIRRRGGHFRARHGSVNKEWTHMADLCTSAAFINGLSCCLLVTHCFVSFSTFFILFYRYAANLMPNHHVIQKFSRHVGSGAGNHRVSLWACKTFTSTVEFTVQQIRGLDKNSSTF